MEKRAFMSFRTHNYGDYVVQTMEGNESGCAGLLLVSISGPGLPNLRIHPDGGSEPLNDEDCPNNKGMIIFGSGKQNRVRLAWPVEAYTPIGT